MTEQKSSIETPWGEVGYVTYKRTYSRKLNEDDKNSPTEEWEQTVDRVVKACNEQLNIGFRPDEEEAVKKMHMELKGTVAGRFLWQLGTTTVDKLGMPSLQNCAFTVVDGPIRPFTWAFDLLMLGAGVGYNIQRENVYQIPKVKNVVTIKREDKNDADFIVPDSREGWVELLTRVLEAHFITGKGFTYACHLIRSKGAPIKGFGGTASGPDILVEGLENISKLLNSKAGMKIHPVDAMDIMNIIGSIVVAGNVRRSAQIAIGDYDDIDFLRAKRWDLGNIPNWRSMSNNSVVCDDTTKLPAEFWEGYRGNGEPYGLINLTASRRMGRTGEIQYPDPGVQGFNPCAEQSLEDKESCCLAEVFLSNIDSYSELLTVLVYLYRINKHSLAIPCAVKETEAIVHKNMRMGIGVTGYLQATEEQRSWLKDAYVELRNYDKRYSEMMGFPTSIKLTTVKPSGTLSLLPGVTPGAHPGYAQYYKRRIRMNANSPIVQVCRDKGYHVEWLQKFDGSEDHSTVVVTFPAKFPKGTILASDVTAIDQLEVIKRLQAEWSDNAVSVTIYYRKEELEQIQEWLKCNFTNVKSVSFLLHSDHGFNQAPLEEITQDEYEKLKTNAIPIHSISQNVDFEDLELAGCDNGACPVR